MVKERINNCCFSQMCQGAGTLLRACPLACASLIHAYYGKASLSGFFAASRLPPFWFSSSTEIAAAVNTPAIPASMPPINAHLLLMFLLLLFLRNDRRRGIPAFCMPAQVRLVVPVVLDDLQYGDGYWYPSQWVHMPSIVFSNAGCAAFC